MRAKAGSLHPTRSLETRSAGLEFGQLPLDAILQPVRVKSGSGGVQDREQPSLLFFFPGLFCRRGALSPLHAFVPAGRRSCAPLTGG